MVTSAMSSTGRSSSDQLEYMGSSRAAKEQESSSNDVIDSFDAGKNYENETRQLFYISDEGSVLMDSDDIKFASEALENDGLTYHHTAIYNPHQDIDAASINLLAHDISTATTAYLQEKGVDSNVETFYAVHQQPNGDNTHLHMHFATSNPDTLAALENQMTDRDWNNTLNGLEDLYMSPDAAEIARREESEMTRATELSPTNRIDSALSLTNGDTEEAKSVFKSEVGQNRFDGRVNTLEKAGVLDENGFNTETYVEKFPSNATAIYEAGNALNEVKAEYKDILENDLNAANANITEADLQRNVADVWFVDQEIAGTVKDIAVDEAGFINAAEKGDSYTPISDVGQAKLDFYVDNGAASKDAGSYSTTSVNDTKAFALSQENASHTGALAETQNNRTAAEHMMNIYGQTNSMSQSAIDSRNDGSEIGITRAAAETAFKDIAEAENTMLNSKTGESVKFDSLSLSAQEKLDFFVDKGSLSRNGDAYSVNDAVKLQQDVRGEDSVDKTIKLVDIAAAASRIERGVIQPENSNKESKQSENPVRQGKSSLNENGISFGSKGGSKESVEDNSQSGSGVGVLGKRASDTEIDMKEIQKEIATFQKERDNSEIGSAEHRDAQRGFFNAQAVSRGGVNRGSLEKYADYAVNSKKMSAEDASQFVENALSNARELQGAGFLKEVSQDTFVFTDDKAKEILSKNLGADFNTLKNENYKFLDKESKSNIEKANNSSLSAESNSSGGNGKNSSNSKDFDKNWANDVKKVGMSPNYDQKTAEVIERSVMREVDKHLASGGKIDLAAMRMQLDIASKTASNDLNNTNHLSALDRAAQAISFRLNDLENKGYAQNNNGVVTAANRDGLKSMIGSKQTYAVELTMAQVSFDKQYKDTHSNNNSLFGAMAEAFKAGKEFAHSDKLARSNDFVNKGMNSVSENVAGLLAAAAAGFGKGGSIVAGYAAEKIGNSESFKMLTGKNVQEERMNTVRDHMKDNPVELSLRDAASLTKDDIKDIANDRINEYKDQLEAVSGRMSGSQLQELKDVVNEGLRLQLSDGERINATTTPDAVEIRHGELERFQAAAAKEIDKLDDVMKGIAEKGIDIKIDVEQAIANAEKPGGILHTEMLDSVREGNTAEDTRTDIEKAYDVSKDAIDAEREARADAIMKENGLTSDTAKEEILEALREADKITFNDGENSVTFNANELDKDKVDNQEVEVEKSEAEKNSEEKIDQEIKPENENAQSESFDAREDLQENNQPEIENPEAEKTEATENEQVPENGEEVKPENEQGTEVQEVEGEQISENEQSAEVEGEQISENEQSAEVEGEQVQENGEEITPEGEQLPDDQEIDSEQTQENSEELTPDSEQASENEQSTEVEGEEITPEGEQLSEDQNIEGEQVPEDSEELTPENEQGTENGEEITPEGEQVQENGEEIATESEQSTEVQEVEGEQVQGNEQSAEVEGEEITPDSEQSTENGEEITPEGEQLSENQDIEGEQVPEDSEELTPENEQGTENGEEIIPDSEQFPENEQNQEVESEQIPEDSEELIPENEQTQETDGEQAAELENEQGEQISEGQEIDGEYSEQNQENGEEITPESEQASENEQGTEIEGEEITPEGEQLQDNEQGAEVEGEQVPEGQEVANEQSSEVETETEHKNSNEAQNETGVNDEQNNSSNEVQSADQVGQENQQINERNFRDELTIGNESQDQSQGRDQDNDEFNQNLPAADSSSDANQDQNQDQSQDQASMQSFRDRMNDKKEEQERDAINNTVNDQTPVGDVAKDFKDVEPELNRERDNKHSSEQDNQANRDNNQDRNESRDNRSAGNEAGTESRDVEREGFRDSSRDASNNGGLEHQNRGGGR